MKKKIFGGILFIAVVLMNTTVFFYEPTKTDGLLKFDQQAMAGDDEIEPIVRERVKGDICPVDPPELPGTNGYEYYCDGSGNGCVPSPCP